MPQHLQLLLLITATFLLQSCQDEQIRNTIEGIWVYDYKINSLDLKDPIDYGTSSPIVIDLQSSGTLVVKNFSYKDTIMTWSIVEDSLLNFGKYQFSLFDYNSDSLTLIDYNSADTFWIIYKRPVASQIKVSKGQIKNNFINKPWKIIDDDLRDWESNIEFFDNNTMLYRYLFYDRNLGDSTDNLQIESYGIGEYKELHFLYNFIDLEGSNGHLSRINQLVSMDSDHYTINEYRNGVNKFIKYESRLTNADLHQKVHKALTGRWSSKNSSQKTYGRHMDDIVRNQDRMMLFEGELIFDLQENGQVEIYLDDQIYDSAKWILSKDSKSLLFENEFTEAGITAFNMERYDIMDINAQSLKLRLFNIFYYPDKLRPKRLVMNLVQQFEKTDLK